MAQSTAELQPGRTNHAQIQLVPVPGFPRSSAILPARRLRGCWSRFIQGIIPAPLCTPEMPERKDGSLA